MNSKTKELFCSSAKSNWTTPVELIQKITEIFKRIDLDPCTTIDNPCGAEKICVPVGAAQVADLVGLPDYRPTVYEDGLIQDWLELCPKPGLIYFNPPYGREVSKWIDKAIKTADVPDDQKIDIIGLVAARVDTKWFQKAWISANAAFFFKGRLKFGNSKNSALFPSALLYWGPNTNLFTRLTDRLKGVKGFIS